MAITIATPPTSSGSVSEGGVTSDVSAPQAADPKAQAAAIAKQIEQLKKEGKTAEATKLLNELNTFKGQEKMVQILSIGLGTPTDILAQGEGLPGQFPPTETPPSEAPTTGSSAWTADFDNLLDRLPPANGKDTNAGARFGLEDVGGRALPAMFLSGQGAGGSALSGAALVDHPGMVNLSADARVRSEQQGRIETFKSYERVTQTFWSKIGNASGDASALQQGLPANTLQPLKVAQAKISDAYKTYLSLPVKKSTAGTGASAAQSTEAAGDQVPDIPGPQITAMERAAQSVGQLGKAISSQVAHNGLGLGASQQVFGVISQNGNSAQGAGITVLSDGIDIDSLMIVVMMDATNVEDDMLADQLKSMQQLTDQKKQMRAINDQMKQAEAALSGQMQTEFAKGQADGDIASTITFDQYKAWRNCQYADVQDQTNTDGSHNISWPAPQLQQPCPPIPDWMHTGKVTAADTSDSSGKIDLCKTYGLPPQAEAMLRKIFNSMDPETKANYTDFNDYVATLGMTPASSVEDIANNLTILQSAVTQAQGAASDAKSEAYQNDLDSYNAGVRDFTKKNPVTLSSYDFPNPMPNPPPQFIKDLDAALDKYALGQALAGIPGGNAFQKGMAAQAATDTIAVPQYDAKGNLIGSKDMTLTDILAANGDKNTKALITKEMNKESLKIDAQKAVFTTIINTLRNPPGGDTSIGAVQAALKSALHGILDDAAAAGFGADVVGNGGFNDDIFQDHGGVLSDLFGDLGQGFKDAWNSLWGGGSVTSNVQTDSLSFDANGLHVNVESTQHNSWPASDDHQTTPCTLSFADANPPSFMSALQASLQGDNAISGAAFDKFTGTGSGDGAGGGMSAAVTFPPYTGKNCDPTDTTVVGDPPDPDDPKYGKGGMKDSQYQSDLDFITKQEADLNDPTSQIRRLAALNHTDGSVAPQAETDNAAAQEQAAALPINAQGQVLGNLGTLDQLTAYQGSIDDQLQDLGDLSDIMQMKLQSMMDRRSKFIEALSNMIKKVSDTSDAVVQNMK